VEVWLNTSTVTLRVVGGDEKGSLNFIIIINRKRQECALKRFLILAFAIITYGCFYIL
jgi:hypothetical protein